MDYIKYEAKDNIAIITMDRDAKRNALSDAMSNDIVSCIDIAQKEGMRAIILRANPGVPVWCSGHDLAVLQGDIDFSENPLKSLLDRIEEVPIPVISMVEGAVYAGGILLAISSDIVIAADNATVTMTANKMGIPVPTDIYAYWLKVTGLHKMKELLFTAAGITAQDAYNAGIYNHIVALSELENFTYALAQKIMACAPEGIATAKLQLNSLARSFCLPSGDNEKIEEHRSQIINSPDLKIRIDNLLAGIQNK